MEYYKLKAIETTDFQGDVDSIDNFVYGIIDQTTWQSNPIICEGKEYIKYKPVLDGWLNGKKVVDIQIPDVNSSYNIQLDTLENYVEVTNVTFYKKVADVVLGVQRGVDVYFKFLVNGSTEFSERCLHFSEQTEPWTNKQCLEKVIERIESGELIKTEIKYEIIEDEPMV